MEVLLAITRRVLCNPGVDLQFFEMDSTALGVRDFYWEFRIVVS